ncbi:MAG: 16S rRNA (guanine(527)-N(7))-methyltransferase RsmG [Chloroflexi bacterium]|nr:16S rRNA (guanine(527)-N(7))-methyltransferase RsmG [Chloroflexota bacterium]
MEILAQSSQELGIFLTPMQLEQFQVYHEELAEWNQRVNLTSVVERREVQVKHFLDSFTVCLALPGGLNSSIKVVDVGAGAGFPGLPLKIAFPEIQLSLVESVGKKAAFLEHMVSVLGLSGVDVYTGRAETLAHEPELRESFDLAVTRGVAKLATLAEYTLPFCRTGGKVVALKHGGIEGELAAAAHALEVLGGRLGEVRPVDVSGLTDNRVVVTVEKTGITPEQYPRRPGMPAKRPL